MNTPIFPGRQRSRPPSVRKDHPPCHPPQRQSHTLPANERAPAANGLHTQVRGDSLVGSGLRARSRLGNPASGYAEDMGRDLQNLPDTGAPGPWFLRDVRLARTYFGVQAVAGALWWITVFASDQVRFATLGALNPVAVFWLDLPLFVLASGLAAAGWRPAAAASALWTALVATGMAAYATITTLGGWGAILMVAAAIGSVGSALVFWLGRVPSGLLLRGPLAGRTDTSRTTGTRLRRTAAQTSVFWVLFLAAFPLLIAWLESRWGLAIEIGGAWRWTGAALFLAAGALGIWSAVSLATTGKGTPLPSAATTTLVIRGPYRFVRNPMALGSIAQGVAVGVMLSSWLVVLYAIAGALVWDWLVRPHEEQDLAERFGEPFRAYQERVRCWIPTFPRG